MRSDMGTGAGSSILNNRTNQEEGKVKPVSKIENIEKLKRDTEQSNSSKQQGRKGDPTFVDRMKVKIEAKEKAQKDKAEKGKEPIEKQTDIMNDFEFGKTKAMNSSIWRMLHPEESQKKEDSKKSKDEDREM